MIDTSKKYTYKDKPVRVYADGSDTFEGKIHCGIKHANGSWIVDEINASALVEVWEPKAERINMTKEDLLNKADYSFHTEQPILVVSMELLNDFFDSNVVIPKGKIEYNILNTGWVKSHTSDIEFRIKPSEPIYEWQWVVIINKQARIVNDGRFHTDEELGKSTEYIKIEETKRVRK